MTSAVSGQPLPATGAPRPPVVFVVYQTSSQANGGVESISRILEHLTRFRPIVVTQRETRATSRWRERGIEVHVWSMPEPSLPTGLGSKIALQARRVIPLLSANSRVAHLVRRLGARAVHCNDILAFWHAAPGARMAGARVLLNIRDLLPPGNAFGLKWQATHLFTDDVVVLSHEMRERVITEMRPLPGTTELLEAEIHAIYSIVDLAHLHPPPSDEARAGLRDALGIEPGCFAIGYVGSFCDKKNQLQYISQAVPRLAATGSKVITYFIGDFSPETDPYARECQAMVARLGLGEHVRFVGFADRMDRWYPALDIICLASRNEGLARSMIESLACGTPVVSFDVCSAREILEGYHCGRVARQGDYASLVQSISDLASNPSERRSMAAAGRRTAEKLFAASDIQEQYQNLYSLLSMKKVQRSATLAGHQP